MMALALILLICGAAALVCVWALSSMGRYERAMRKLEAQRRREYYARKRELAGLPQYDQREPLQRWLARKASTKAHEETKRNECEAFRRHCATHISS